MPNPNRGVSGATLQRRRNFFEIILSCLMFLSCQMPWHCKILLAMDMEHVSNGLVPSHLQLQCLCSRRFYMCQVSRPVTFYLVMLHAAGLSVVELCFVSSPHDLRVLEDHKANPFLIGLFTTVSLSADAGFNLIDESYIPFTKSLCLLIWLGGLIFLGNTMYPTCLRGVIVLLHRYSGEKDKLAYEYLLQHSRKCFTHLFHRKQTMWLLIVVMVLNAIEMISFMSLEWKSVVVDTLDPIQKIVVAYFQSINTCHASANAVIISKLAPALLSVILMEMFIQICGAGALLNIS